MSEWDAQANTMEEAMDAVWSEPDWWDSIGDCLENIVPHLDIQDGGVFVEIGCGIGRLTIPLALEFPYATFIGYDISPRMVALAYARKSAFLAGDNVGFVVSVNGESIDSVSRPETLDGVYSMLTFQHIPLSTVGSYIYSVGRMLRPGGAFRFQFVEGFHAEGLDHRHPWGPIRAWLGVAGMKITRMERLMHPDWLWVTAVKR